MGEVELSILNYEKAISLFPNSALCERDQFDITNEMNELKVLLQVGFFLMLIIVEI